MRLFAKVCLVFVLLVGCSELVRADPIRIQSGSTTSFNLSAGNFNLTDAKGNKYVGSSIGSFRLLSYQPGSIFDPTLNFFQTFGQNDFRGIYNNGTSFPVVYIFNQNSSLNFSSPSFQFPALNNSTFSITFLFTKQGILTRIGECFGTPLCNTTVASNNVTGNGIATYNFSPNLLSQDNR